MGKFLTPTETKTRLRCSLANVYAMSSKRIIPKYKVGSRLLFKEEDIEEYLEKCRIEAWSFQE